MLSLRLELFWKVIDSRTQPSAAAASNNRNYTYNVNFRSMAENSGTKKRGAPHDQSSKRGSKKGKFTYDKGGSGSSEAKAKFYQSLTGIEPGTQGIFATCDRGKEPRCVGELYSLFDKYAEKFYGDELAALNESEKANTDANDDGAEEEGEEEEEEMDIEAMMKKELEDIRDTGKRRGGKADEGGKKKKLFVSVKLDAQCVVYFRTNPPISPSSFVHAICKDAIATKTKQSRVTHRLTPIERTGKATVEGLEDVAKHVLKSHFHSGQIGVKFAIRPSIRNHDVLKRDSIIQAVARCVGPNHKVDLKNYDVLILVEIYKNICGMSVVRDWEKLKRFNLAQIQESANEDTAHASVSEGAQSRSTTRVCANANATASVSVNAGPNIGTLETPQEERHTLGNPASTEPMIDGQTDTSSAGTGVEASVLA